MRIENSVASKFVDKCYGYEKLMKKLNNVFVIVFAKINEHVIVFLERILNFMLQKYLEVPFEILT